MLYIHVEITAALARKKECEVVTCRVVHTMDVYEAEEYKFEKDERPDRGTKQLFSDIMTNPDTRQPFSSLDKTIKMMCWILGYCLPPWR